jgi:hypothetical protein
VNMSDSHSSRSTMTSTAPPGSLTSPNSLLVEELVNVHPCDPVSDPRIPYRPPTSNHPGGAFRIHRRHPPIRVASYQTLRNVI